TATGAANDRMSIERPDCRAATGRQATMMTTLTRKYRGGRTPGSANTSFPARITPPISTACRAAARETSTAVLATTTSKLDTLLPTSAFQCPPGGPTRHTSEASTATPTASGNRP